MESNAGGMVRRRALKTRFSDKGMGFDSSALRQDNAPLDKLAKSLLSKGRVFSVRLGGGVPTNKSSTLTDNSICCIIKDLNKDVEH